MKIIFVDDAPVQLDALQLVIKGQQAGYAGRQRIFSADIQWQGTGCPAPDRSGA